MNNVCPGCGALYAVASKDIGRKIKCKKCSSGLIVTDTGLELDAPPPPVAVVESDNDYDEGDEEIVTKGKKGKKGKYRDQGGNGGGFSLNASLAAIGGLPTLLFGFGVFLVIWFTFMPKIGEAAVIRAAAGPAKLEMEQKNRLQTLLKGKNSREELSEEDRKKYDDEAKKLHEEYAPKVRDANNDLEDAKIDIARSLRFDRYGTMFGFLFVAFGCIGFLRTEQPLVMRIVAAVILSFMMMVVFSTFGGCGSDKVPGVVGTH